MIVGSNTNGCKLCGSLATIYLPNSGIPAKFGLMIFSQYTAENLDLIGFEPDIWCDPNNSLDAVKKLIVDQGLVSQESVDALFR